MFIVVFHVFWLLRYLDLLPTQNRPDSTSWSDLAIFVVYFTISFGLAFLISSVVPFGLYLFTLIVRRSKKHKA